MTHYFSYRNFSLTTAPLHTRILITAFNVVILVALCVGFITYWDKTGMTPAGVTAWYRGNEGQALAAGQAMTFEKTFRELLDATHPHLFGQGVLLFILSHIVALTGLRQRMKIVVYLVSFGAMLLDASVPWLIRYVSPALAPVQLLSIPLLTAAFVAQMVFPIREMWFSNAQALETATSESRAERPAVRPSSSERRQRRPQRDSHHRTGPAPRSEPRGAGGDRPKRPETGGESVSNPERRGRRRRGGRRSSGPRTGADRKAADASPAPSSAPNSGSLSESS